MCGQSDTAITQKMNMAGWEEEEGKKQCTNSIKIA